MKELKTKTIHYFLHFFLQVLSLKEELFRYETNILTGGAGIRYFGADASGQYREDKVSIYIRAVSTAKWKSLENRLYD